MPRQRTHKATYQRRNELARERGFSSYSQQRKALDKAKKGDVWKRQDMPKPTVANGRDADLVRLYYEAFYLNPNDYSRNGPKAKWFVTVAGLMTYDEWAARYPNGVRTSVGKAA